MGRSLSAQVQAVLLKECSMNIGYALLQASGANKLAAACARPISEKNIECEDVQRPGLEPSTKSSHDRLSNHL